MAKRNLAHWADAAKDALAPHRDRLHALWALGEKEGPESRVRIESELDAILRETLRRVLQRAYD